MKPLTSNLTAAGNALVSFVRDQAGATAIDLIAALISVVIIANITAVGTQLTKTFTNVSTALSNK